MLSSKQEFFTPPEVAKLLGIDHQKVIRWIANRELRAVDVSLARSRLPRWRISKTDLEAFLARRSTTPPPKVRPKRKPRGDEVINFYPDLK